MEQLWDETAFTSTNINQKQTDDAYAQLCASVGIGQQNNGMDIPAEAIDRRRIKAVRWLRFWQSAAAVSLSSANHFHKWLADDKHREEKDAAMEQLWDETAFTSTNINQKQTDDAYAQLCASVGIGQQNNGMDIPAEAIDRRRIKAVRWLRFWQSSSSSVCHQPTISISGWLMTNTVKKRMLQWSSFGTRRHSPLPISTKSRLTMLTPSCVPL